MTSTISTGRLDRTFGFHRPIPIYPILPKINEYECPIHVFPVIETEFKCKRVVGVNRENIFNTCESVRSINLPDDNNFPSIDNSESGGRLEHRYSIKPPIKPKSWKREKTFDGSPIYRVLNE